MLSQILNSRGIAIYLITYLLLLVTAPGKASVIEIMGGFSPIGSTGLKVISIMRWNLCVMPPVIVSILFMSLELGKLSCYTVIRTKSISHWFVMRYICVVLSGIVYLLCFMLVTTALGYNVGCGIESVCVFMLVFSVHITLVSTISVTLLITSRSHRVALLSFFAIDGGMVVVGSMFPSASKYILPFWGMANNEGFLFLNNYLYLLTTVGISILLLALFAVAALKWLRANNPAANPQNI
ncbi:hypothetical protein OBV_36320 [Oscillibacter valericigenes Sjm18-20]|nr:hypothetical protein OBV_36320 [Oscillibacter valericigenes Sjm18-20]